MKAVKMIKQLPDKLKAQLMAALLLVCMVLTFAVPAFNGGYSILKTEKITSSAGVSDVDLLLVGSSAFGEARKVMNSTNPDAQEQFIKNMNSIVGSSGYKWQNLGLLLGPKDALSGSTWNVFQNPTTLSLSEVQNYNKDGNSEGLEKAYEKYKAFGYAVEVLNLKAKKSHSSAASLEEGLDSMSFAALKLGNFGVKFLNDYNPAPVALAFYDSSNLATYSENKLVKIVKNNQIMKQIICLFGDKVGSTGVSFFVLLNAVVAVVCFTLSMLLTLLGNQSIGDGVRKFLIRIVVGTIGMYLIGNLMSVMLTHVSETVLNVEASENVSYIENNLNVYDWYLTGFSLPSPSNAECELKIGKNGQFQFNKGTIKAINEYTYKRLTGKEPTAEKIKKRMEDYTANENFVTASFVTPTYESATNDEGNGEAWATDVYYAIMENFANNTDLMEGSDNESSALNKYAGQNFSILQSRYLWMSQLSMTKERGVWKINMPVTSNNYYGLNPISAFNLLRTEFSGDNITATSTVYPTVAYVAYDAVNVKDSSGSNNMNSILRFIAIFTIIMAALKGMITIFTAGFGGILAGSIKTATGSSYGLGQALGGVIAMLGGLIGISLILSVTMTLLDAFYGIAYELLNGVEIIDAILSPIEDAVGDIPLIGDIIMGACKSMVGFLLTLIFSLTFPKLGGIPINVFCQYMADIPGRIAERAQMIEGMLLSGHGPGRGGLGRPGGGGGHGGYGKMAAAQASQAFGNAQRQTVGVISGVAGAAAALGGVGLTAAGKALNKKADGVEGKPSNPGLDNWDDLSPEQQSAAAAAAADAGEDWDNMDQDARQKAMEERMEAEKANAQEASQGDEQSGDSADEQDSVAAEELDAAEENADVDGDIPDESSQMSMSDVAEGAVGEASDDQSIAGEDSNVSGVDGQSSDGEDGEDISGADGQSIAGDNDSNDSEVSGVDAQSLDGDNAGDDNVTNYNDNQESLHAEQNVGNEIKADADARSVDNSTLTEEDNKNIDGQTDKDNDKTPVAGNSMNDKNAPGSGIGAEGKPESMSASVQNNQTANMKNDQTANIKAQQVDKSKATTMNKGTGQGQRTGTGSNTNGNTSSAANRTPSKTPQPDTGAGQTAQGLNGTAKSAWGKEMSVKEQRKARLMHAMGDGLQMAGGNRTVGDGLRDAAGHMKDAAVSYTVSDDVLPTLTSSVRDNRIRRQQRMRRNRQNNQNQ